MANNIFKNRYGYRESNLIVPKALAEIKVASKRADIVLDPTCGSGTVAEAASKLQRRFICIDREQSAVKYTWCRLKPIVQHRTRRIEWLNDRFEFEHDPMLWDSGHNYIVRGDSIRVLRSMPDSFIALVYTDPPFNANKQFRNKKGEGFSDIWRWNDEAETRLVELENMPDDRFNDGKMGRNATLMTIQMAKMMDGNMASYLTWTALLLIECRRVMGSYEMESLPQDKLWTSNWNKDVVEKEKPKRKRKNKKNE